MWCNNFVVDVNEFTEWMGLWFCGALLYHALFNGRIVSHTTRFVLDLRGGEKRSSHFDYIIICHLCDKTKMKTGATTKTIEREGRGKNIPIQCLTLNHYNYFLWHTIKSQAECSYCKLKYLLLTMNSMPTTNRNSNFVNWNQCFTWNNIPEISALTANISSYQHVMQIIKHDLDKILENSNCSNLTEF